MAKRPLLDDNIPAGADARYDFYLRKAAEAGEKAVSAGDPVSRASWQRVADSWRELAEQFRKPRL